MPTYQYACTECDHAFEQFQSFSDDSLTVCPQCEGRLRKVFNAVGVVFKGSGFYRTDSRGSSTSTSSDSASTTTSTKDSSSSSGSSTSSSSSSNTPAGTGAA
ncbi:FmdB family zinc ribbon protein [Nocardioides massiliensis]|uniref:FmdB family regulatory protein n=1 Tax=Nocardioides massiliensis TaxID=1325935 RepID=A0ABT9NIP8_9ACTN|nr:FmdB family zinc ribbon protein [Nocardioides massiliensis]MDP9820288.1 putative FmdB family regulatory protein [Nocardioides massiliensis]